MPRTWPAQASMTPPRNHVRLHRFAGDASDRSGSDRQLLAHDPPTMPKILILYPAPSVELVSLVDAVVEGARSVRFAEVDVRSFGDAGDAPGSGKQLRGIDDLASYDGIIVGVPAGEVEGKGLLERLASFDGSLSNKVGSAFTPRTGSDRVAALWSALSPMADRGMILVPLPFAEGGESNAEACRRMGKRVAEVVGWVTHARSHHHH